MHASISVSQEQHLVHELFQFVSPLKNQKKNLSSLTTFFGYREVGRRHLPVPCLLGILCLFWACPFDMSSSICLISLLLFRNAEEGGRLGAGQRRHLQALWGILWKWKAMTFRCFMVEQTVHNSLWPLLFSRMAWCANLTRADGCSHINITESSLGPRAFFHVFEKRLEEPLHLCLLWGQMLAKSKVIIFFFFFFLLKYSFTSSAEKNVLTQMVLIFFFKTW